MIRIDRDPPDRRREPVHARPAVHVAPQSRTSRSASDDERPSERPSLFVVPPPQTVWPRVFPRSLAAGRYCARFIAMEMRTALPL